LIDSISGNSFDTEEEFDQFVQTSFDGPFPDIISILAKHLGDEVDITASCPQAAVKARVTGNGLNLILRNGLKFKK